jgi:hypothetical protein
VHAVVTIWRVRDPDVQLEPAFIRELARQGIDPARARGVVDVLFVAIEPDRLMAISLFESLEDALAARPVALAFIAGQYADMLDMISRTTGQLYELTEFADVNFASIRQQRPVYEGPYWAHLATWRLSENVREPGALVAFLRERVAAMRPQIDERAPVDEFAVRTADDALLVVRLLDSPEERSPAAEVPVIVVEASTSDGLAQLVDRSVGRAYDVPTLLS